jgi:outer membrane protein assembly factor BamA
MPICLIKRLVCLFATTLCTFALFAQDLWHVSDIVILGNQRTNEKIILRELSLQKGDAVLESRINQKITQSKENLGNLSLFNYVEIDYEVSPEGDNTIVLHILVEERWYFFPFFSIKLGDRNTSTRIQDFDIERVTFEGGAHFYNVGGLNHAITAGIEFGYQQGLNFHYKKITLGRAQKHFLTTGISLQRSHKMDVMTLEDAPLKIKRPDLFLSQSVSGYLNYTYRHDVRRTHNISFGYEYKKISDTILQINPDFWGNSRTERLNLSLQYFFRVDQRDYIAFPLKGHYLKTEGNIYLSDDLSVRYFQAKGNAQYYWTLGNRWYASERLTAGLSLKNAKAYILDRALGYEENVLRGYEYHVIDGQHFIASNSTLRYNIIPKRVFIIDWLSALPKFNKIHYALYAHTFIDIGCTYHHYPNLDNHLSNMLLYGSGVGFDFVTYYDMVFSLSFAINRQKEHGFYFSFKLPIL